MLISRANSNDPMTIIFLLQYTVYYFLDYFGPNIYIPKSYGPYNYCPGLYIRPNLNNIFQLTRILNN